jgi:hypothetical protein
MALLGYLAHHLDSGEIVVDSGPLKKLKDERARERLQARMAGAERRQAEREAAEDYALELALKGSPRTARETRVLMRANYGAIGTDRIDAAIARRWQRTRAAEGLGPNAAPNSLAAELEARADKALDAAFADGPPPTIKSAREAVRKELGQHYSRSRLDYALARRHARLAAKPSTPPEGREE